MRKVAGLRSGVPGGREQPIFGNRENAAEKVDFDVLRKEETVNYAAVSRRSRRSDELGENDDFWCFSRDELRIRQISR